jgi:DNA-binding NarL/FixJ family response regulator
MPPTHTDEGLRAAVISRRTVESHVSSVFAKLGIAESPESSRRVLAVLAYLQA